jgi:predicted nucleotide-binding protein
MSNEKFHVAIMHGHSNALDKVEQWVSEAGFTPRVLKKEFTAGVIFQRLRNVIWDEIYCVIVIMSADDQTAEGNFRARQNVVFEMGYCFGAFDSLVENNYYNAEEAIIFLKEQDAELFADINGLTYLEFSKRNLWKLKDRVIALLQDRYERAKKVYRELK